MVLRITMLIAGTFLMTYSTSPIALTDAMEILFGPLKKLKVPVHEMSRMMYTAMRAYPHANRADAQDQVRAESARRGSGDRQPHPARRSAAAAARATVRVGVPPRG
jgi:ABC-type cobalt transport system, permease component CbiQ and related transporters